MIYQISYRNLWIMQALKWMWIKFSINYWIYILQFHQQHSGCDRSFLNKQRKRKNHDTTKKVRLWHEIWLYIILDIHQTVRKVWHLIATTVWSNLGLENCVSLVNFQFFTVSKRILIILIDCILINLKKHFERQMQSSSLGP